MDNKTNEFIELYRLIKKIPDSKEKEEVINFIDSKITKLVFDEITSFITLGKAIGFDYVGKILADSEKFMKKFREVIEKEK